MQVESKTTETTETAFGQPTTSGSDLLEAFNQLVEMVRCNLASATVEGQLKVVEEHEPSVNNIPQQTRRQQDPIPEVETTNDTRAVETFDISDDEDDDDDQSVSSEHATESILDDISMNDQIFDRMESSLQLTLAKEEQRVIRAKARYAQEKEHLRKKREK